MQVVRGAGGVTLDRELGDHNAELAPAGGDGPLAVGVGGVQMGMVGGLQAQVAAGYKTTHCNCQLQSLSYVIYPTCSYHQDPAQYVEDNCSHHTQLKKKKLKKLIISTCITYWLE